MKNKILPLFTILITLLITFFISANYYQLLLIHGDSMYPAYHNWQFVLIEKQPSTLKAGDVIAFRCPALNSILVKRIAAVPGDTVIIKNGTLFVNNIPSQSTPRNAQYLYSGLASTLITLCKDEYFVLGDNYKMSKDSRHEIIGIINSENILGRILPQIPVE